MSNATIAHTREIARQARSAERHASRIAKYSAVALDWHGHTIAEYEATTWGECVDESRRLLATNASVSLVDMWENN